MAKNYYQILGVEQSASTEDIKKAYRRLAHKYHPDKKGGDEKKFKEISEAYQILNDKNKREQYDKFGRVFEGHAEQGGEGFEGFGAGGFQGFGFGGQDFDFGSFGVEDLFEQFFNSGVNVEKDKRNINRGADIEVEVKIDLKDVLQSFERKINLAKKIVCSRCAGFGAEPGTKVKECFSCKGKGQVQQIKRTILGTIGRYVICPECKGEGNVPEKSCNVCKGQGRIEGEESISVSVPAGVDSGQVLKFVGKGEAGKRGVANGNLYVRIYVRSHSVFKRKGDDIYFGLPISFSLAALGGEVEIVGLDGKKILLKIPSGTESGKIFKISDKGLPHFSGWGKGNMYVELLVETPKKLTKKQKELLEKLREEGL
jgi:molecular chaperone DnaJ